jgi:hypothetical protein
MPNLTDRGLRGPAWPWPAQRLGPFSPWLAPGSNDTGRGGRSDCPGARGGGSMSKGAAWRCLFVAKEARALIVGGQ